MVGTKYPISALDSINAYNGSVPSIALSSLRAWYNLASGTDGLGISKKFGALRLFDLLGYGYSSARDITEDNYPEQYGTGTSKTPTPKLSVFRFAAYQKVYQDFYRNPYWEPVDVSAFNFDDFFNKTLVATTDVDRLNSLFQLRYRNWTKDFFTSIQPSFQGAPFVTRSVNMSNFGLTAVSTDKTFGPTSSDFTSSGNLADTITSSNFAKGAAISISGGYQGGPLSIPVHNIRAAFALDKLFRLQQQSGNGSYGEQIRNRFGFGGVHDDWKSTYIGGSSSPISIGEVITTANTEIGRASCRERVSSPV